MSIEDIIRAIEAERDALQVEIDQRIDLHGLLDRTARQLAEGATGVLGAS